MADFQLKNLKALVEIKCICWSLSAIFDLIEFYSPRGADKQPDSGTCK